MSCVDLQYISSDECIGASLPKINGNFAALSAAVCELSSVPAVDASINVFDSPTIDLNWNASTRTLSAVTTASVVTSSSPMAAKAYVDFWVADLGNPVQAYNISSITDIGTISLAGTTGTGLQVNFTTPMPTAKYSVFTGDYNGYCSLAADTGTIYVQPDGSQTTNSFILFNAGAGRTRFRYRAIVFYNP